MNERIIRRFSILLLGLATAAFACNFPSLEAPAGSPKPFPFSSPTPFSSPAYNPTEPEASSPETAAPGLSTATPASTPEGSLPAPTRAYQPVFEPTPCAFPVPPGYEPECGYLVVPENRAALEGPSIRLHVAVFRSRSPGPAPDPVVHLAGGPGSSSLGLAGYMFQQGMDAILERRDLILFDQRGTGYSHPRLDCPEREALTPVLLERGLIAAESGEQVVQAFRSCRDRLVAEGIDLSAYNSAASAADVNDLRLALSYEQVNLYAVSYGTRLALTVMRDHPESVRSAVLDSAYPLEVNLYTALAPNAERAFEVFFDLCSADPACSGSYPDLRGSFYQLVNELNADPLKVSLNAGGVEHRVKVDGGLLVDVLFVGLYNRSVAARMPRMVFDLKQGETGILEERLRLYFDTSSALGMQMAVQCAEEIPFSRPEEAFLAAQGVQPEIAAFFPDSVQPLFAACEGWSPAEPDPRENQPVASRVPALVLGGAFDPITPPDWGRRVAGSLQTAYFFELPANGHWVTRSSACARSMALTFWEDPASEPDSSCVQSAPGLEFQR
jgi:pimeloyl-ACP methyl ester carboxylesterase